LRPRAATASGPLRVHGGCDTGSWSSRFKSPWDRWAPLGTGSGPTKPCVPPIGEGRA
jgi:hypothetical protein